MSTYTKIKTLPLSLFNNAEYLSFMNHVLDLANGNSGGGDSESPSWASPRNSSIPTRQTSSPWPTWWTRAAPRRKPSK